MITFSIKPKRIEGVNPEATIKELRNALEVILEFAYFMAKESGIIDRVDYIFDVLRDHDLEVKIDET